MFSKKLLLFCIIQLFELIVTKDYEKHSVYRIIPKTEEQLKFMIELENNSSWYKLDFWKSPVDINIPIDLMVEEKMKKSLLETIEKKNIQFSPFIESVEELINEEKISMLNSNLYYTENSESPNEFFKTFHTLGEINRYLTSLEQKYPDRVEIEVIGKSFEKRPLNLIKIGTKNNIKEKKVIWLDAGIHAREWISVSTAMYIAEQLIKGADTDIQIKELINEFDFYILPVINVDGYVYSHTNNRFWRKTRSVHSDVFLGIACHGVDGNRNFDFHWLEAGASWFSCSQAYAGPKPFSESETKSLSKKILQLKNRVLLYVSLHSYSQLILVPWGYTKKLAEDYSDLEDIARKASIEVRKVHGKIYKYGSAPNVLYSSSGGADDWVKGVAKVKYAFTIELRDQGNRGFILPPKEIVPTGEEIFAGIKNMTLEIGKEYGHFL